MTIIWNSVQDTTPASVQEATPVSHPVIVHHPWYGWEYVEMPGKETL